MAITRSKPEEIVVKLRQVEVLMGQGMPRPNNSPWGVLVFPSRAFLMPSTVSLLG